MIYPYDNLFLGWLAHKGKSSSTITVYDSTMKTFTSWYEIFREKKFDPNNVSADDFIDYKKTQETILKKSPSTLNREFTALKAYWRCLNEMGFSSKNPLNEANIKSSPSNNEKEEIKWLSPEEQHKLISLIESEKNELKRKRNLAIIHLMINAGLTVGEIYNLNLHHIDMENRLLTITSKNNTRSTMMNLDLYYHLRSWLDIRKTHSSNTDAVFISERQTRLTQRGILHMVKKALDECNLDYTALDLRNCYCKKLVDQNMSIEEIAKRMGHKSLMTTQRYVTAMRQK